jgi:mycothiol system anti-sigma-R factor
MDCQEAARALYDYLDRELDGRAVSQIQNHLEKCRHCFGNYQFNAVLKKLIQKMGTQMTLSANLELRIKKSLEETA